MYHNNNKKEIKNKPNREPHNVETLTTYTHTHTNYKMMITVRKYKNNPKGKSTQVDQKLGGKLGLNGFSKDEKSWDLLEKVGSYPHPPKHAS